MATKNARRIAPLMGAYHCPFHAAPKYTVSPHPTLLRTDLEKLDQEPMAKLVEALKNQGVSQDVIEKAMRDMAA